MAILGGGASLASLGQKNNFGVWPIYDAMFVANSDTLAIGGIWLV